MPARSPSHILMTADTVGGVWTYALGLASALQDYGVSITLAAMGGALSTDQRRAAAALENVDVHQRDYKLEWMDDPWSDVAAAGDWLLELASRVQPDIVHLNGYAHGALDWNIPVLVVGHSCVYSWFAAVKGEPPPSRWERYRRKVTRGLAAADRVTAPTEAMLDALERHYGPFARTDAIYNGRRAEAFPPREAEPFVLSAGRLWDEAKNVAALDAAAPTLSWPVRVAGSTRHPNGDEIELNHVQCLGRLPGRELADRMGRASIFAHPARYEPFGLTPLEAGLAGCALVLGDLPTLREVWGDAATFVPPDDPAALSETVDALISAPSHRRTMADRARNRARRYTLARMGRQYISLYEQLLRQEMRASPVTR